MISSELHTAGQTDERGGAGRGSGALDTQSPIADPEACAACAHPWTTHDALAARFCTATAASSQARGCICV